MPPKSAPGGAPQADQGMRDVTKGTGLNNQSQNGAGSMQGTGTQGMQGSRPAAEGNLPGHAPSGRLTGPGYDRNVPAPDQTTPPSGLPGKSFKSANSGSMGSKGTSGSKSAGTGDVRQVQQQLKDAGFDPGPTDGILDPRTKSALKRFQRDRGISATGRIDSGTMQALGSAQTSASEGSRSGGSGGGGNRSGS